MISDNSELIFKGWNLSDHWCMYKSCRGISADNVTQTLNHL